MELKVASALKQPGQVFEAVIEEELPAQRFAGRSVLFEGPVRLEFSYSYDGKAFTLSGRGRCSIKTRCARCDEPFIQALEFPIQERFVKGDEEEDSYAFDDETLVLDTMTLDNLFLHMPIQSVCRQDCRGLCPLCGCNLNTAQCGCELEGQAGPVVALGSLFDDKEV